jgi:4-amino-4-deoxy-L-arabinose transferase-like glycosyltransferase
MLEATTEAPDDISVEVEPEPVRRADWGFRIAIVAVLIAAFAVRVIGVTWHLPYVYHADEPTNYSVVRVMMLRRSLDPRFFHYPSLFFYVYGAVIGAWFEFGRALGWFHSVASMPRPIMEVAGAGVMPDHSLLIAARMVTVGLSTATVGLGMLMCRLITPRRSAVLLAGALLAFNPTAVRNARWFTPDSLAALTATAAIVAAVVVAKRPRLRHYIIAGVLIGLAVSAKYNVALVAVALVVAHFLARREEKVPFVYLVYAAGAAIAAFFVTSPYALFDAHRFWSDFTFEIRHYNAGHPGNEGNAPQVNADWVWASVGPALLLLFGMFVMPARVRRLCWIPFSFVVLYFVAVSVPKVRFERNLTPLLPALLVVAAIVGVECFERVRTAMHDAPLVKVAGVLAALAVVAWPAVFAIRQTNDALTDYKASARTWIQQHVPPQSHVVLDGYSPWLDPAQYKLTASPLVLRDLAKVRPTDPDAIVVTQNGSGRYLSGYDRSQTVVDNLASLKATACDQASFNRGASRIWVFRLRC